MIENEYGTKEAGVVAAGNTAGQCTLNNNEADRGPKAAAVDVIIPVFNEEEALPGFLKQLHAVPIQLHPIFIDNGSTDNSLALLRSQEGATVVCHEQNLGYGASLRAGIRHSTAAKIIIIDADGEYSPRVIPDIVAALEHTPVVHTSRFLPVSDSDISPVRGWGNRCITSVFNKLFQQQLTDLYTGCKGYRRSLVVNLPLSRTGFEHVLEISARLAVQGTPFAEIPVQYRARIKGSSKMQHFRETGKYFFWVLYYALTFKGNR